MSLIAASSYVIVNAKIDNGFLFFSPLSVHWKLSYQSKRQELTNNNSLHHFHLTQCILVDMAIEDSISKGGTFTNPSKGAVEIRQFATQIDFPLPMLTKTRSLGP